MWGIPVRDPQTRDEAIARAKELKRKFYMVEPPSEPPVPQPSRSELYEARQAEDARWRSYVQACEAKRLQDQLATIKKLEEQNSTSAFRFYMVPDEERPRRSRNLPPAIYFRRIVQWVAKRYGFTEEDLLGDRRYRPLVEARHLAIQIIGHSRKLSFMSLPQIGKAFRRDHTSILHVLCKAPSYRLRRPVGQNVYRNRLRDIDRLTRGRAERENANA